MRNLLLHCVLISALLAGCAALTPTPGPQPTAISTLTPSDPTATLPAPTRSPTPRPSPSHTPTHEARTVETPLLISALVAPNTAWSAAVLVVNRSYLLQVASSDIPVVRWTVAEHESNGISVQPLPLGWSADGSLFYYSYQLTDWDGCFGSWAAHGSAVWKLDLTSGVTSQVTDSLGHWLALSPDGRQMAFLDSEIRDSTTITNLAGILDLTTGETTRAEIAFLAEQTAPTASLDLLWSPDGKSLVIGALTNACGLDTEDRYSILRIDAATLRQEILVKESEEWLQPVKWSEMERVLIRHQDGGFSWLNLSRGTLENWP